MKINITSLTLYVLFAMHSLIVSKEMIIARL